MKVIGVAALAGLVCALTIAAGLDVEDQLKSSRATLATTEQTLAAKEAERVQAIRAAESAKSETAMCRQAVDYCGQSRKHLEEALRKERER